MKEKFMKDRGIKYEAKGKDISISSIEDARAKLKKMGLTWDSEIPSTIGEKEVGKWFKFRNGSKFVADVFPGYKIMVVSANLKEGLNKPGGRRYGVKGDPLKKVKCTTCKGKKKIVDYLRYGPKEVLCPDCRGLGYSMVDPATYDKDSSGTYWENSVGAIAGFNAPMKSPPKKKTMKVKEQSEKCHCGRGLSSKTQEVCLGCGSVPTKCRCQKKYTEMKSFKAIIEEIDLSTKSNTLSSFLTQASKTGELGKQFGPGFTPDKFIGWLKSKVQDLGLHVSDQYLSKMASHLQGMSPMKAQSYVYNAILKGSGMGLSESTKTSKKKSY